MAFWGGRLAYVRYAITTNYCDQLVKHQLQEKPAECNHPTDVDKLKGSIEKPQAVQRLLINNHHANGRPLREEKAKNSVNLQIRKKRL